MTRQLQRRNLGKVSVTSDLKYYLKYKSTFRLDKEYINLIKEREGDVNEAIRDEELEAQGKLFKPCAEQVGRHFSVRYLKPLKPL